MVRFVSSNGINMISCGDYNWEIMLETDGSEVYRLLITIDDFPNLVLLYGKGIFSVREFKAGDVAREWVYYPCFKIDFKETPRFVKALIEGEGGYLYPLYCER